MRKFDIVSNADGGALNESCSQEWDTIFYATEITQVQSGSPSKNCDLFLACLGGRLEGPMRRTRKVRRGREIPLVS